MTSLSQRKVKRILSKRERQEGERCTREFRSYCMQSHFSFYTTPERELQQSVHEKQQLEKIIPGEYFEVESEIMEVAFSHPQGLTKKSLSDSGVFTFLAEMDEAQARFEYRESNRV